MHVIATAGHVDHGKSALVRALTGIDPDRWEEEKRRGLTIDLGFAFTTLPSGDEVSFIDVPGHIRFLRNMLAGIGGVDACLLVVAANEGWKPQTEEHLRIIDLLGINHGAVVLTKTDLVDQATLEKTMADAGAHVSDTFLDGAPIISVSSTTGDGLDVLREYLVQLVARKSRTTNRQRPRLWIDRIFVAKGSGTVVTGTLTDGAVQVGDELVALPSNKPVKVRGIQTHGKTVDELSPGQRCALNLSGVDHHQLDRGAVLVHDRQWKPTHCCDARLTVLASLKHDVGRRGNYMMYIGSGEFSVSLRVIGADHIASGQTGSVRLRWDTDLPLLPGDRFILRETGREETIGGGEVLDIDPLLPVSQASPDCSIERVVRERGWISQQELEMLTGEVVTTTIGDWIVSPSELKSTIDVVQQKIDKSDALGIELALLSEHEHAVIGLLTDIQIITGRVFPRADDGIANHRYIDEFLRAGCTPPSQEGLDVAIIRQLVQRNIFINCNGIIFHAHAIVIATTVVKDLLRDHPQGFAVSQFREALQITRKHAVPLIEYLDQQGITRRHGDLRLAGARLYL
ncbi:MAG: selenocysteine-specific translation elongation factor [Ilumatobacteraceae bacterium]